MSNRNKPLKVSGLLSAGKINPDPAATEVIDFHAPTRAAEAESTLAAVPISPSRDSPKILLALIDDSPYQPRIQYDPLEIDNLAHSLAAAGQEDPITVRSKADGRYELIGGHRRIRAARSLGWTEITASLVERTDREAKLATMVQNEARIDLTDYERGKLYLEAQESGFASTQTDIAHLFGTSQGHVSKRMAMLKLPSVYIDMLEGKPDLFGVTCAESIMQLIKEYPDEEKLIENGVRRIAEEGADQKSVRQWVQQMVKQKHSATPRKEHAVITDRSGRAMFTAKFSGRELMIRIKATEVDAKDVEEIVLAALRQHAEKNSGEIIQVE